MIGATSRTGPLITVLIAAHDAAATIRQSVLSALWQSVREVEVIVVDDGSNDSTVSVIKRLNEPRIRIVESADQNGLAAALLLGLEHARSRFVARLDADDVAMPNRLSRQYEVMRARPNLAVLGTAALALEGGSPTRLLLPPTGLWRIRWASHFSSPLLHPTVMFDRVALHDLGMSYDPAFVESEDYDLWSRALRHVEADNLSEPLTLYRVHPNQASQRRRALQRELQRAIATRTVVASFPELATEPDRIARVWAVGAGETVQPADENRAVSEYLELFQRFAAGAPSDARRQLRRDVGRLLVRRALTVSRSRSTLVRGLRLEPGAPLVALQRITRETQRVPSRARARRWLKELDATDA
jgi:hypothetical protein